MKGKTDALPVCGEAFNKGNVWGVSLNDDTFNDMKMDFDKAPGRTLSEMERRGSESAEMTVSLKINLRRANVGVAGVQGCVPKGVREDAWGEAVTGADQDESD